MAQSISEIHNTLMARVQADATLGPLLTSNSKVAIWRLWCYIVAVCYWSLQNLHDLFKSDVNKIIADQRVHSASWYAAKAKAFQYGFDLGESDTYDNTGISDSAIAASQVINYVAVVEQGRFLRIKVATIDAGDLAELPDAQLTAFTAYMNKIKDAGVHLLITTGAPDGLKLTADIYYNALVLNSDGNRLDGTNLTPVQDAINNYLKNLPFNGVFALQSLVDQLQLVDGVTLINLKFAAAQYGALPYTSFGVYYIPDSGYLRIITPGTELLLTFIPYSE